MLQKTIDKTQKILYTFLCCRSCSLSSVGQSNRLITGGSKVRILEGAPNKNGRLSMWTVFLMQKNLKSQENLDFKIFYFGKSLCLKESFHIDIPSYKKSKSVSRVLSFKLVIYLGYISLYSSSHASLNHRAGVKFNLGVAPDGVYTDALCHHKAGELLPRLFILAASELTLLYEAVIFCCTFLKVTLTRRYLASLLYGARTFLS